MISKKEKNSKRKSRSFFGYTNWFLVLAVLVASALFICVISILPYQNFGSDEGNDLGHALRVFSYNESKHFVDPVPSCWYDSGDYIVFTQRNAQTLYYLSLAYAEAKGKTAKADLYDVVNKQLKCLDGLLEKDIKQIRDQRSHVAILPPLVNQIMTPQPVYIFEDGEGRDVYILRSLIAENMLDNAGSEYWLSAAKEKTNVTVSSECCEEGVIQLSNKSLEALERMIGIRETEEFPGGWGIDFSDIALLQSGDVYKVKAILKDIESEWNVEMPKQFDYIGGNYDIAGTVALERMYAKKTGDQQFKQLSESLFSYLHGGNGFDEDFTEYAKPHHPCGQWWANCQLVKTLINGVDESLEFDTARHDIWRLTEVQLLGQAEYVLALVLYLGL